MHKLLASVSWTASAAASPIRPCTLKFQGVVVDAIVAYAVADAPTHLEYWNVTCVYPNARKGLQLRVTWHHDSAKKCQKGPRQGVSSRESTHATVTSTC